MIVATQQVKLLNFTFFGETEDMGITLDDLLFPCTLLYVVSIVCGLIIYITRLILITPESAVLSYNYGNCV